MSMMSQLGKRTFTSRSSSSSSAESSSSSGGGAGPGGGGEGGGRGQDIRQETESSSSSDDEEEEEEEDEEENFGSSKDDSLSSEEEEREGVGLGFKRPRQLSPSLPPASKRHKNEPASGLAGNKHGLTPNIDSLPPSKKPHCSNVKRRRPPSPPFSHPPPLPSSERHTNEPIPSLAGKKHGLTPNIDSLPPSKRPNYSEASQKMMSFGRSKDDSLSSDEEEEEEEKKRVVKHQRQLSPSSSHQPPSSKRHTNEPIPSLADKKRGLTPNIDALPLSKRPQYSEASRKMMESMGYKPGKGLGKKGEGITAPIAESSQLGRRGLGFATSGGLEKEDVTWEEEEVNIEQEVQWLNGSSQSIPEEDELISWMVEGERKNTIAGETEFTDPDILNNILKNKSEFDDLSTKEFLNARLRSNPYETIKGAFFQNRAAMKMANIDACTGFMFSEPKARGGRPLGGLDILYFADICAGPGGFSEYILWRKKWETKGFGFTLKDPDIGSDFKLDAFSSPCETFDPHYGVNGYDGNGDITRPDNQSAFRDYVMENTEERGVHFVMADGGISVEGQENIQELLLKQLVLCQYTTVLAILRPGGCCVVKVFDMFTEFSVGLFYLFYRCFRSVAIFKPVTSRPANSERYVICRDLREGAEVVANYMYCINEEMVRLNKTDKDILQVVPQELMKQDEEFYLYIRAFNDSFGMHQVKHLKKLQHYVKNSTLHDTRQAEIRRDCLKLWKVPDNPRTTNTTLEKSDQIFTHYWLKFYGPMPAEEAKMKMQSHLLCLNSENFPSVTRERLDFLRAIHSWKWCWALGKRLLIVGLGRNQVKAWDMRGKMSFISMADLAQLELPQGTILEVESVTEFEGESGQKKQRVIYISDVLAINNEYLGWKPPNERREYAVKLAKVLSKPCRRPPLILRAKKHYRVAELASSDKYPKLALRQSKGSSGKVPTITVDENQTRFLAPIGIIFFKIIKDPWQLHIGSKGMYFSNPVTKTSRYDCPQSSVATFLDVLKSRHKWVWDRSVFKKLCLNEEEEEEEEDEEEEKTEESKHLTRKVLSATLNHFLAQP